MSTGIESWNVDLLTLGPMYPFPGSEMLWFVLGLASWLLWHWLQGRREGAVYRTEAAWLSDPERLERAMLVSNAETLNEALKTHGADYHG